MWTSIASKETIVVAAAAVLAGVMLRMHFNTRRPGFILPSVALVILYIFKPHYLAAVVFVLLGSWLCARVRQPAFLVTMGGLASLLLLYLMRNVVDELAFSVQRLMFASEIGRSGRAEKLLVDKYDVFWKAPEGMFQAFMGPSLTEIMVSPLALVTFIESGLILFVLMLALAVKFHRIPAYNFLLGIFTIFWLMFPNYPFGIVNIGTAIRYRSGWIIFVFAIIAALMSREAYFAWRPRRGAGPRSSQDGELSRSK